ncbi:MAG: hypothetical protein U1E38_03035, partial [Rhodospirillales bacterium]
VAVGGRPGVLARIAFTDGMPVLHPRQIMAGELSAPPGKAVVLDAIGDEKGMGVAEWLCDHGWQVEVVTRDMFAGQRLTASQELTPWNQRAAAKGIAFRPQVAVQTVDGSSVSGIDAFDRTPVVIDGVDLVVPVAHEVPDEDLYFALKDAGVRVFRAGDCVAPRSMASAILEGYRAGREV